ncbi:transcriptional regulator, TetR family [Parafrankia sp. EAN1pec]|uniref:TetR/AcrR family transcriptional regulator n=1 Tax=Parafrankia sp. (strain EAN1pec) TaxID=298653 RepID=UPI0000545064|nr:transcriptional regulator, TetR family [Frankia sp. EAN1pec]
MSRRDQLQATTAEEIKGVALKLMTTSGPDAISLRAIAREMGMAVSAIYRYYAARDDLVSTLISDVHSVLVEAVESARDAQPEDDPAGRIIAWSQAFRDWAITNPSGFKLVYGDPVPGYQPPEGGPAPETQHRVCTGLIDLIEGVWPCAESRQPADRHQWSDFDPRLVASVREEFPELPPAAVALAVRLWGRMHGLVSLEIYGHLRTHVRDPETLYRAEMHDLVRSLGLIPTT